MLDDIDTIETTNTIALAALIMGGPAGLKSAILFASGDDPPPV